MSIGIFITPEEPLKSKIFYWKEKVEKELNHQPYLTHPAHMTIINLDLENEKNAISKVRKYLINTNSFNIDINQNNIFFNDISTSGHTIYYGIDKTPQLENIQNDLANILAQYRILKNPPKFLLGYKILLNSYKVFGFPFIGSHWIPHFTIASLRVNKNHSLIKEFLSIEDVSSFLVDKVSIWRITGEDHHLLEEIYLT